jgi:predicted acyltransferase
VSTIPAIASCLLGVSTGEWMRGKSGAALIRGLLVGAVIGLGLGKLWSLWFPINKNLWTSSYAVFMAGMALIVFAICYWLVDAKGYRGWSRPFAIYGMNAIAVYVLAGAVETLLYVINVGKVSLHDYLYSQLFQPLASPANASLLWSVCCVLVIYAFAYGMYRRGWFIRV